MANQAALSDAQRTFLDEVHYGVVGTLNADGTIQQTVVWFLREGDDLRFSIGASSVKLRNLQRNPIITLTVGDGGRYLSVSGVAELSPVDPSLRLQLATRYLGAEEAAQWVLRRPDVARASVRIRVRRTYGQGV